LTSNTPYLIAVVVTTMIGVAGVVAVLILRPHEDNAALFVAIGGFVAPTTAALLAFLKTQETHLLVNSRMDEFKKLISDNAALAETLAHDKGVVQGLRELREKGEKGEKG